jgi:hypothetical protein
MKLRILLILALAAALGACSTAEPPNVASDGLSPAVSGLINEDEYSRLVDKFSVKDEKYQGFYSAYQFRATILNSSMLEGQLSLKAQDLKWTRETYFAEKEKIPESLARESKIFLGFYSPVAENDNLDSNKTLWKFWLVADGIRYEGTATKQPGLLAQNQRLYPYFSRFYTPYVIVFKVPMAKIQTSKAKFILTGAVGTSEVEFPAL